jgi:hypothetical protein
MEVAAFEQHEDTRDNACGGMGWSIVNHLLHSATLTAQYTLHKLPLCAIQRFSRGGSFEELLCTKVRL